MPAETPLAALYAEATGKAPPTREHPATDMRDCGERLLAAVAEPAELRERMARVVFDRLPPTQHGSTSELKGLWAEAEIVSDALIALLQSLALGEGK